MTDSKHGKMMQGAALKSQDEWAMSERRERAVMRDVPSAVEDDPPFRLPKGRGILSKAEIQALLRPELPTINDDEAPQEPEASGQAAFADFDREMEDLSGDARRIAAKLALMIGQVAGLKAGLSVQRAASFSSLSEARLGERRGTGEAYLCFGDEAGDVSSVLTISGELAERLVTTACGGDSASKATPRYLSAIDCALLEQLAGPLCRAYAPETSLIGLETDADYVASILPEEAGEVYEFEVSLPGQTAGLSLIRLKRAGDYEPEMADPQATPRKKPMTVVLTARVASLSVPVSRVSSLKPGDTLLLGLPADQPVELLSGGRDGAPAFEGEVGRKGTNMADRIRKVRS